MRVVENEGMYVRDWQDFCVSFGVDETIFYGKAHPQDALLWTNDIREALRLDDLDRLSDSFLSEFPNAQILEVEQ